MSMSLRVRCRGLVVASALYNTARAFRASSSGFRAAASSRRFGGGAFGYPAARLSPEELERVTSAALCALRSIPGVGRVASPCELAKESYGDVDIVYEAAADVDVDSVVRASLGCSVPPIRNGVVTSYLTAEGQQVDLIRATDYNTTLYYLSHGDLSQLLGAQIHPLGLQLGMDGLSINVASELTEAEMALVPKGLRMMKVCDDPEKIFEFLGVPLIEGPVTMDEMVKMVLDSTFFTNDFDGGISKDRRRAKRRPSWVALHEAAASREQIHSVSDLAAFHDQVAKRFLCSLESQRSVVAAHLDTRNRKRDAKKKFNKDVLFQWSTSASLAASSMRCVMLLPVMSATTPSGSAELRWPRSRSRPTGRWPTSRCHQIDKQRAAATACSFTYGICRASMAEIGEAADRAVAADVAAGVAARRRAASGAPRGSAAPARPLNIVR